MKEELRKFIIDNFMFGIEEAKLSDDDSLVQRGLIDSTGVLELVSFIQEKYGVAMEDSELVPENLDSINQITCFLNKKQAVAA
jgi:acyl carrier protein